MTEEGSTAPVGMGLCVSDIGLARSPGQFKLSVSADRQWVEHEVAAWSIGLRWTVFGYGNLPHDPESRLFAAGRDELYLTAVEQTPFENWMLGHLDRHQTMHDTALRHGLAPGGETDLPVERLLIDRLLKELLRGERIDIHGPAERMASNDDYLQFLANDLQYMQTWVGERRFQLRQMDDHLPELSAEVTIGGAVYHGFALDLAHALPHVLCVGAIGRRLGDLVATGLAELDRRTITEVVTSPEYTADHRLQDGWTRLELDADLVELGA